MNLNIKQKYVNAYENWYCVICEKHKEEPVSFSVYLQKAPLNLILKINEFLKNGNRPV